MSQPEPFDRSEGLPEPPLRPADEPGEDAPDAAPRRANVHPLRPAGEPPGA